MAYLLAADIGGTKTLLQLSAVSGEVLASQRYVSADYQDFEQILTAFLAQAGGHYQIDVACLAIAGPVNANSAKVTNLPWQIHADKITTTFDIAKVILCNDFEAVGYGVDALEEHDLLTLHAGQPAPGPRALIGAGTGLGQAYLVQQADEWQVIATEGGHTDFAPTDRTQVRLLEHLFERFGHVSYERLVSGSGLETIYHFLRDYRQYEEDSDCRLAMMKADAASVISEFARKGEPLAKEAMNSFFSIYGAQAGNLALTVMPKAGLYIAGGIAAKNLELLEKAEFMAAFLNKGRMQALLERIPVKVILDPEVGLNGARLLASKAMYN